MDKEPTDDEIKEIKEPTEEDWEEVADSDNIEMPGDDDDISDDNA